MERVVDEFVVKEEHLSPWPQDMVEIYKKDDFYGEHLILGLENGLFTFCGTRGGLPTAAHVAVSEQALQAGIEMVKSIHCKTCPYQDDRLKPEDEGDKNAISHPYCQLAHGFVADLGDTCLKDMTMEEIRTRCEYWSDEENACMAHPIPEHAACFPESLDDIVRCDFKHKK